MNKIVVSAIMFLFFILAEVRGWGGHEHYDFIIAAPNGQFQGNKRVLHSYG